MKIVSKKEFSKKIVFKKIILCPAKKKMIIWFVSTYDFHLLISIWHVIYMHLEGVLMQKEYHAFATEQVQVVKVGWR